MVWSDRCLAATNHYVSSRDQTVGFKTLLISHDVQKTDSLFSPSSLVFLKCIESYTKCHVKRILRFLISPFCLGGILHLDCVLYTLHSIHRADSVQLTIMMLPSLFRASQLPAQSSRNLLHDDKSTMFSTSLCVSQCGSQVVKHW